MRFYIFISILFVSFISCNKNSNTNQLNIQPVVESQPLSVIFLMADGLGINQITAAWHQQDFLNLQQYPYSGLVFTHANNRFVTESGAANTALMTGIKTNYGFLAIDPNENSIETLYEFTKKNAYLTGLISTSYMADATLASLFTHRNNRYDHEEIILDYFHNYPDFAVAGGQKHFDNRTDGKNLLDSLSSKGVNVFYTLNEMNLISKLPCLGMMHESLPPYLSDGRKDFLLQSSQKALDLFSNKPFFLYIESAHIDKAGHDMDIDIQLEETLEYDRLAGLALSYAKAHENVLVIAISDHECGALTLLSGDNFDYTPNYAIDEHSGEMVAVFAYGPGAENFTGMMDNADIYFKIKNLIDNQLKK